MPEIRIIIEKDGSSTIVVNGVKGGNCTEVTKQVEKALGGADSERKYTSEYYEGNGNAKAKQAQR